MDPSKHSDTWRVTVTRREGPWSKRVSVRTRTRARSRTQEGNVVVYSLNYGM